MPEHERCAARGAALFHIIVGEQHALVRHAFDVGRVVAHHAFREDTEVGLTDVVPPEDEDVGFASFGQRLPDDPGLRRGYYFMARPR